MNQTQIGSFEHIPLAAIRPSTTNPRKHFDPAALEELTASVRELGVTVPIHVRSVTGVKGYHETLSYELVTGERRFRAATAVGLEEIPAIVHVGLEDEHAMDLQLVENLQRADLHPVEEADGYRALIAHGESAEDVAKMAGKTLGYVQQRLKLLTLEVDAKQLFLDKHLTLDHALLLARLTPADQEKALRFILELNGDYQRMKFVDALTQRRSNHSKYYPERRLIDKTAAQLKDWIGSNVFLQLKGVPWDLGDGELVPIAGPCTTCSKRTGANQALFADLTTVEDTCVDRACFADKQKAFTLRAQTLAKEQGSPLLKISAKSSTEKLEKPAVEIRPSAVKMQQGRAVETKRAVVVATRPVKQGQWIAAKKGSCPSTVQAIAVDGPDQGKLKWVCPDQECKAHPRHVSPTHAMTHGVLPKSAVERNKRAEEEQQWKEKLQHAVNAALLAEIDRADAQHAHMMAFFVGWYVENGWNGNLTPLCEYLSITIPAAKGRNERESRFAQTKLAREAFRKYLLTVTAPELDDIAVALLVGEAAGNTWDNEDLIEKVAAALGIDVEGIEKAVRAKAEADGKAKAGSEVAQPEKTVPAKKSGKKKGGV